jgi:predicted RNA-binding Zn ribbon-like protein
MIEIDVYDGQLDLAEQRLCLEFANTAEWHASDHPLEELNSYTDLVAWAKRIGLVSRARAHRLDEMAARRPVEAAAVLEQAVELREALYRIFSAIAHGRTAEAADVTLLNGRLSESGGRLQIQQTTTGFAWRWQGDGNALDQMLWPVARSAAELLVSEDLARVKECADDRGCGWLFVDTSRNRSRRWCSMESCGNWAKVRRHRRKQAA